MEKKTNNTGQTVQAAFAGKGSALFLKYAYHLIYSGLYYMSAMCQLLNTGM